MFCLCGLGACLPARSLSVFCRIRGPRFEMFREEKGSSLDASRSSLITSGSGINTSSLHPNNSLSINIITSLLILVYFLLTAATIDTATILVSWISALIPCRSAEHDGCMYYLGMKNTSFVV